MTPELVFIPVEDLKVTHDNPRIITREDLEELKLSLERDPKFLEARPILVSQVNGLNIVYAGAQRLRACMELGIESVPCFVTRNVPKEVLQKRMLLDNVHSGTWDISGDNVSEFSGLGSLSGDRFKFDSETVIDFNTSDSDVVETPRKRSVGVFMELEFSSLDKYNTFLALMADLREADPDTSVSLRLLNHIKSRYGSARNNT